MTPAEALEQVQELRSMMEDWRYYQNAGLPAALEQAEMVAQYLDLGNLLPELERLLTDAGGPE